MRLIAVLLGALAVLGLGQVAALAADAKYQVVIDPSNSYGFVVMDGQESVIRLGAVGWGPNWGWTDVSSNTKAQGDTLKFSKPVKLGKTDADVVQFGLDAKSAASDSVRFLYTLKAEREQPLTAIVATISPPSGSQVKAVLTDSTGAAKTINLPIGVGAYGTVQKIVLTSEKLDGEIEITFEPATLVTSDGGLRVSIASEKMPAGEKTVAMTLKFPEAVAFRASEKDIEQLAPVVPGSDWFAYQVKWDFGKSVIAMDDWLEKPAGKRGGVRSEGGKFQFEDGTPVKFWGTNLSYGLSAPQKADADFTAARYAKYGVNAVRMHKFTGPGWEGIGDEQDATKMKPEGMERLDYFSNQLAQKESTTAGRTALDLSFVPPTRTA